MSGDAGFDPRAVVGRIVEQRYQAALDTVAQLTAAHPDEGPDALAARIVRQYARDLAVGGAVAGGAAASPAAGASMAAAAVAGDATYGVSRLGEMVMAIGIVNGLDHSSATERAAWVGAVLGISEGAAVGLTGMAARAGAAGGSRVLARLSTASAAGSGRARRLASAASRTSGPWSLATLLPYGIGAGVGAAGNAALAYSVGRAARRYFRGPAGEGGPGRSAADGSGPDGGRRASSRRPGSGGDDEIWEAEFIEERILDVDTDPPR
jgi:hypothetical protein